MRSKRLLIGSIALAAIGCAWFSRDSVLYEHTDDAHIDGEIVRTTARINGQIQQVNVIEGQMVHVGEVLAVIDQKECGIAVYKALADLTYAENNAASLYYNAVITVASAYGSLDSAQNAVKNALREVAAASYKLRGDEAALQPSDAVTADRRELLELEKKLLDAIADLRRAQTAPEQVSLAKTNAQAADAQVMRARQS